MASTCFQQKRDSFPSAAPSDSKDDGLLSVEEIITRARRAPKKPAIDLTDDDADNDVVAALSSSTSVLQPLPTSSSHAPIHTPYESPSSCGVAASPGWKRSPFKNRPQWSLFKTTSLPPRHSLHAASDNDKPTLAASELSSEDARALVSRSADSLEIAKTPKNVCNSPPPAKRRCRASSAASSVSPREVRTTSIAEPPHDNELYADMNRKEMLNDYEWQAQRIVGERQTPSGLEYETIVQKTLWLPRAVLDTKLVRRYRREQRAVTRVRTRWSLRLQTAVSSARQCR